MFDIAWSEMIVIGAVALIAIGPKDLPKALRAVGAMTAKARRMAAEFQDHFREAMREAELESVRQEMANLNQDLSAMSSGIQSEVNALGAEIPAALPGATPLSEPPKGDATAPVDHPSPKVPGGSATSAAAKQTTGTTLSVEASPGAVTVTETTVPAAPAKPARKKRATAKGKPKVGAKAVSLHANGSRDASARPKASRKRVAKVSPLAKPPAATEPVPPGDDRAA
jgi:sec-independent protein translocase protein TatB